MSYQEENLSEDIQSLLMAPVWAEITIGVLDVMAIVMVVVVAH